MWYPPALIFTNPRSKAWVSGTIQIIHIINTCNRRDCRREAVHTRPHGLDHPCENCCRVGAHSDTNFGLMDTWEQGCKCLICACECENPEVPVGWRLDGSRWLMAAPCTVCLYSEDAVVEDCLTSCTACVFFLIWSTFLHRPSSASRSTCSVLCVDISEPASTV